MNVSPTVKTTYRIVGPKSAVDTLQATGAPRPSSMGGPSGFKYYIHDGVDSCRFQLTGELSEADVAELEGCWRTARTTLGKRKLVVDLRGLNAIHDAGIRWVTSMAAEGALYVPSPHLHGLHLTPALVGLPDEHDRKGGPLAKLAAILRSLRLPSAQSSTPAR